MRKPIGVIAIDADGSVVWAGVVRPRRLVVVPRAAWIAETPSGSTPAVGENVVAAPILAGWPAP
ncbi:MAG: hypothetical protein A2Z12_04190 [Actinobacteria bacterium RBG_16_68_21]|nr:MAG: hypothetical protein A2Z12_04190 [Actinobacteria bacterium RBG_16_68_21]